MKILSGYLLVNHLPVCRENRQVVMNRELRCCPNCDANEYINIITVSPSHFVPLNHSYCTDVLGILGINPNELFPIVRCRLCGFHYSLYILNSDLLNKLYNQCIDLQTSQSKIYKVHKRKNYIRIWSELFYLWSEDKNDQTLHVRLLDYGCGWGDFMLTAQMPGLACVGLEYDRRKIAYVQDLGFEVVDSHDHLARLAPFDLFFCNQVLEHLSLPKVALRHINGCLSMGAYGYISVPDFCSERVADVVNSLREGKPASKDVNPWEHLNYFSPTSLVKMLHDTGFRVLQSNDESGLKGFLRAAKACMRFQKNRLNGRLSRFLGKTVTEPCARIHNRTSLYVQKIRVV